MEELADAVAGCLTENTACVIMKNHGALTVGADLLQAFDRMEVLENAAKINIYSHLLGPAQELSDEQRTALDVWAGRNG